MIHSPQNRVLFLYNTVCRIPDTVLQMSYTVDVKECTVCGVAREISIALYQMFRITFSDRINCVV